MLLNRNLKAFTLVELVITMVIVTILAAAGFVAYNSLAQKRALQAEANLVKEDIYLMQSKAITNLKLHRFYILSSTTYKIQEYNTLTSAWVDTVASRTLTSPVTFTGYTGKETKLHYQANGLPLFNGASTTPFFTLTHGSTTDTKDFNIDSSGVVNIITN